MRKPTFQSNWPESWKMSYAYDAMELYGDWSHPAYTYAYSVRFNHTMKLIQKVAKPGAKILDVAAAQGNFTLALAELGYEVTWNDLREELADYVALKYEFGTVDYVPGNVLQMDTTRKYDIVLMAEVIEHVAYPDRFLNQVRQFIKPGGYIIVSTPNGEYIRHNLPKYSDCSDPSQYEKKQFGPNAQDHIFLLHIDEIRQFAITAGLIVEELHLYNNPLTSGHFKSRNLFKLVPSSLIETVEHFTQSLTFSLQKKIHAGMVASLAYSKNL